MLNTFFSSFSKRHNFKQSSRLLIFCSTVLLLSSTYASTANQDNDFPKTVGDRIYQPFKGDLDELRERRILRVLVSYNKTNFFHTKRGNRGIEHDLIKAYEKYLNRGPRRTRYKTYVVFLARPFEKLLPDLLAGNGDIVASGLTITPERQSFIDFTDPYIENVDEILISNIDNPAPKRLEELSGKQVIVVANSSYIIHLEKANQALGLLGLAPIEIVKADSLLEAEDLLEMVNAGLFEYTVVDNHIAEIYHKVFKNLRLNREFVFHHGGKIAWAINKNLPLLKNSLNHFIADYARPGKLLGNSLYKKYFKNPFWIKQPLSLNALTETPCLQYYFEKYAVFFDFDWYLIASQAYQESGFKQNLKSTANAVGVMQIKPSTAASKIVNIPNINKLENNILAGVKYLAFIRDYYFDKPEYSSEDKINFSLAAYNAGPGRVRKMQRLAESKGLDPHKWHYNVEVIARQEIGHETVDYVTKIQKTKIALKLAKELAEKKHWLKSQQIEEFHEAEQQKNAENLIDDSNTPEPNNPSQQLTPAPEKRPGEAEIKAVDKP